MTDFFDADEHYGYRIAALLNQGYIVASPEIVFKEPLIVLHSNHHEHAQRINISKVPPMEHEIPIPPVKPPLTEGKSKIKKQQDTGLTPTKPPPSGYSPRIPNEFYEEFAKDVSKKVLNTILERSEQIKE